MADALSEVELEINEATAQARRLIETTDGQLFTVRPNPQSWSAAECLAHLTLTSKSFVPVLQESIDAARNRGLQSTREPKMDLLGHALRWFMEPPIRKKVTTTARFVPQSTRAKAEAFAEFTSYQSQLIALVRASRGLDLTKAKVASPFDKRVRYNVFSAFRVLAAHERRHLWQAEQTVATLRSELV
ncbi:MAG TPA: DinB family protein [Thermoanaerobaculia bacterium]